MTPRDNISSKVVFLVDPVLSLSSPFKLQSDDNRTNRPSSPNQNREPAPYFDRIQALLRSNEDNEENQPQPLATSIPIHSSTSALWFTKPHPQLSSKSEYLSSATDATVRLDASNPFKQTGIIDWRGTGFFRLVKELQP